MNVHHLTYDHLGAEHDDELIVLCRPCHQWVEWHKDIFGSTNPGGFMLFEDEGITLVRMHIKGDRRALES